MGLLVISPALGDVFNSCIHESSLGPNSNLPSTTNRCSRTSQPGQMLSLHGRRSPVWSEETMSAMAASSLIARSLAKISTSHLEVIYGPLGGTISRIFPFFKQEYDASFYKGL